MIEIEYNGRPRAVTMKELALLAQRWPGRLFARFNRRCSLGITDARTRARQNQIKACGRWYDCEVVERIYTA